MKLKSALIAFGPPALVITVLSVIRPTFLTWTVGVLISVSVGVFSAFVLRLLE